MFSIWINYCSRLRSYHHYCYHPASLLAILQYILSITLRIKTLSLNLMYLPRNVETVLTQLPQNFGRFALQICRDNALPQIFHSTKVGKISVFYAALLVICIVVYCVACNITGALYWFNLNKYFAQYLSALFIPSKDLQVWAHW